jgi:hypothetical protein
LEVSYDGVDGLYTVFPTAKRGKAPKAAKAKRGRKPRKPRKPRQPKTPKAPRFEDVVYLPDAPKPTKAAKERRETRVEARARRRLETKVERAASTTLRKGAVKVLQSPRTAAAAAKLAQAGRYLASPVGKLATAGASTAAGTLALVAGAGVASFLATSAILKRIADRKERAQQAAFVAAQQMRRTRLEAEKQLGRPLTAVELKKLAAAFDLKTLMSKAGL